MKEIFRQGELLRRSKAEDKMSSLPDELLILVIRTSLLSTRWQYLWTCIPNYTFWFCINEKRFVDSIDTLFSARDHKCHIEKFGISRMRFSSKFDEWINHLASRNIQELHAILDKVPSSILTCKSLVVLKLHGPIYFEISSGVFFLPKLKTLQLKTLVHWNDASISSLFSGCPVLEELNIHTKFLASNHSLSIEVPSLKKLSIFSVHSTGFLDAYISITKIIAPCLEHLEMCTEYSSKCTFLNNLPSILAAHVRFSGHVNRNQVWDLLSAIPNVINLSLPSCVIEYFDLGYNPSPSQFHNMEHLTITSNGSEDDGCILNWEWFTCLLDSIPKLNKLVFKRGFPVCHCDTINWNRNVHPCVSFQLKTIEIFHFHGGEDELKMVEYFLESCMVLESMIIQTGNNVDKLSAEDQITLLKYRIRNANVLAKVTIL